ncbi:MAG: hypothetical protein KAU07_03080 [Candidatus Andersenbacteria bacterium]|nr:hypothetical protein [Candidatus Andersenbacteria bacterium]
MGLEENISRIITELKEGSDGIKHVLVFSESLDVRSSENVNFSKGEIAFSAILGAVMKTVEDATKSVNMSCEELIIRSAESSIIVRRAGTAFVIVEVATIIPAKPIGILTEDGLSGTIICIDAAVEKIKAVLKQ